MWEGSGLMGEARNWWFMVGPMQESDAQGLTRQLLRDVPEGASVNVADEAQWYCAAVAPGAIKDIVAILSEALSSMDKSRDVWLTGVGMLSDMQTWLEDEQRGG
jgi:hypothetical protein